MLVLFFPWGNVGLPDLCPMKHHSLTLRATRVGIVNILHQVCLTFFTFSPPPKKVFYIDYGTRRPVKHSDLRLLERRFSQLPAQAIHARLAGIKPTVEAARVASRIEPSKPEEEAELNLWPKEASRRFYSLIREASEDDGLLATILGKRISSVSPP